MKKLIAVAAVSAIALVVIPFAASNVEGPREELVPRFFSSDVEGPREEILPRLGLDVEGPREEILPRLGLNVEGPREELLPPLFAAVINWDDERPNLA